MQACAIRINSSSPGYLTFSFTGFATDVTYEVQATNDPSLPWTTIYTFPSGSPIPPGTVTVRDQQSLSDSPSRFLRLNVTSP